MFDFLRNRGSTAGSGSQEKLSAYLDNALTPDERLRLESELNRDPALRAEMEQMRLLKLQMRAMPRRRVPRSFALDPALYGRPKAQPMMQLYPVLRGATALAAFLFIFTLALGAFQGTFSGGSAEPAAVAVSMSEQAVEESAPELAAPAAAEVVTEEARFKPTTAAEPAAGATPNPAAESAEEAVLQDAPAAGGAAASGAYPGLEDIPPADLSQLEASPMAAPTPEPGISETPAAEFDVSEAATATALVVEPASETGADRQTEEAPSGSAIPWLRAAQVALGVGFVLLLILWLIARRRVRSY